MDVSTVSTRTTSNTRSLQKRLRLPRANAGRFPRDHDSGARAVQFRQIAVGCHADRKGGMAAPNNWTVIVRFEERALQAAPSGTSSPAGFEVFAAPAGFGNR